MITRSLDNKIKRSHYHKITDHKITWSQDHMITRSHDHKITWSQDHMITRSHDYKITWLQDHMITRSHDYNITWSQDHMITRSHDYKITWSQDHKITLIRRSVFMTSSAANPRIRPFLDPPVPRPRCRLLLLYSSSLSTSHQLHPF